MTTWRWTADRSASSSPPRARSVVGFLGKLAIAQALGPRALAADANSHRAYRPSHVKSSRRRPWPRFAFFERTWDQCPLKSNACARPSRSRFRSIDSCCHGSHHRCAPSCSTHILASSPALSCSATAARILCIGRIVVASPVRSPGSRPDASAGAGPAFSEGVTPEVQLNASARVGEMGERRLAVCPP